MQWMRRHPGFAFAACLGTVVAALACLASREDAAGQSTLGVLAPFMGDCEFVMATCAVPQP